PLTETRPCITHHRHRVLLSMISNELVRKRWLREKMLIAFLRCHAPAAHAPTRDTRRWISSRLGRLVPFARECLIAMFFCLFAPAIQGAIGNTQFSCNLRFWFV